MGVKFFIHLAYINTYNSTTNSTQAENNKYVNTSSIHYRNITFEYYSPDDLQIFN